MKRFVSILCVCLCSGVPAQEAPKPGSTNDLAAPLRRFDRNKDGQLDEAEMKDARQTHNRGGREAEPNPRKWREQLDRREKEFVRTREKDFDADGDGKLNDAEKKGQREVWGRIATDLKPAGLDAMAQVVDLEHVEGALDEIGRGGVTGRYLVQLRD